MVVEWAVACGGGNENRTQLVPHLSPLSQMITVRIVHVFLISRELSPIPFLCGVENASGFAQTTWPMCFVFLIYLFNRGNNYSYIKQAAFSSSRRLEEWL